MLAPLAVPDAPSGVDDGAGPVLVLGGDGVRVAGALTLAGVADGERELVLSSSAGALWELAYGRSCDEPTVVCVTPVPETTYGEALLAGGLASERGWEDLTVVTSDFHVRRTRWQFAACAPGLDVTIVGVVDDAPPPLRLWRAWREALAFANAFARTACR